MFAIHADELFRWNRKINLTAITDPTEAAIKHFLDALVPAHQIPDNTSLLDVGTGGGFPGIPLKVIKPSLTVTLVDATLKKINFVRQVIRTMNLDNITAVQDRAESLINDPLFAGRFDTVICRAFDALPGFVSLSHGLIRTNGRLIAMKGPQVETELKQLETLKLNINGRVMTARDRFSIDVYHYTLPVLGDQRSLIILTPDRGIT